MSIKPKILVTSAAGKTGMPTALQLLHRGFPVRAFVRRDDHRARTLKAAGADIFVGDQFDMADMENAMAGVQRAYHCAPAAPNGLHFGAVFTVAAHQARLEHIVSLDQWLSHPRHPSAFTREVWLNRQMMELLPNTSLTVNNVGWFADNYFMVLEPAAQLGVFAMPLGEGAEKKNAPPSNEDIAAVNVEALIDPDKHAGKVYRPTGPELLSPNDIAATFTRVFKRKVVYRDISEAMLSKALSAAGEAMAMQSQLRLYLEEYRRGTFAVHAPSTVLPDVAGRQAEDFETITRRYAMSRPEAKMSLVNRVSAMRNFARLLLTPRRDFDAVERQRDHVLLRTPEWARDNASWRRSHDPVAGFVADKPTLQSDAASAFTQNVVAT